jgi:hypothetical protein
MAPQYQRKHHDQRIWRLVASAEAYQLISGCGKKMAAHNGERKARKYQNDGYE